MWLRHRRFLCARFCGFQAGFHPLVLEAGAGLDARTTAGQEAGATSTPCLHYSRSGDRRYLASLIACNRPRWRSSDITLSTFQSSAPVPSTIRSALAAEGRT